MMSNVCGGRGVDDGFGEDREWGERCGSIDEEKMVSGPKFDGVDLVLQGAKLLIKTPQVVRESVFTSLGCKNDSFVRGSSEPLV